MVALCNKVVAIAMPSVPFCIPDSIDMVRLCLKGSLINLANIKLKPSVRMFNIREAGPANLKKSTRFSFSLYSAEPMINTKNKAETILNAFCDFTAKSENLCFKNIPIATGTATINRTVKIVLNKGNTSD